MILDPNRIKELIRYQSQFNRMYNDDANYGLVGISDSYIQVTDECMGDLMTRYHGTVKKTGFDYYEATVEISPGKIFLAVGRSAEFKKNGIKISTSLLRKRVS